MKLARMFCYLGILESCKFQVSRHARRMHIFCFKTCDVTEDASTYVINYINDLKSGPFCPPDLPNYTLEVESATAFCITFTDFVSRDSVGLLSKTNNNKNTHYETQKEIHENVNYI